MEIDLFWHIKIALQTRLVCLDASVSLRCMSRHCATVTSSCASMWQRDDFPRRVCNAVQTRLVEFPITRIPCYRKRHYNVKQLTWLRNTFSNSVSIIAACSTTQSPTVGLARDEWRNTWDTLANIKPRPLHYQPPTISLPRQKKKYTIDSEIFQALSFHRTMQVQQGPLLRFLSRLCAVRSCR
jgi:hypothetical protein